MLRSDGRKTLRPVGSLALELASDTPLPVVYTGERVSDLTVTRSRRLRGKLGFEVLGAVLQAMGSTPTVATELSREDGATIVLTGVTRDSVAEATSRRTSSTTSGVRRRTRQLAEEPDRSSLLSPCLRAGSFMWKRARR